MARQLIDLAFVAVVALLIRALQSATCVVVDGNKKPDVSATKRQASELSTIDSYNTRECGLSDPNQIEHEFINMAREGQFPWIVSFQISMLTNATFSDQIKAAHRTVKQSKRRHRRLEDLHFCSGSLISDRWILSAAHCFAGDTIKNYLINGKLKVVAGSHRVLSRDPHNKNLTIARIYAHSRFDRSMPVGFDIALVELAERVSFSEEREQNDYGEQVGPFMNSICLPLSGHKYAFNETARIAGWGLSNSKDVTSMPSKLLTTDILISDKDKCVRRYIKSMKSQRPREQEEKYGDFVCANFKNTRDACQSDSGGPLMQYAKGKAIVIGIISYGIGCATKAVPGIYTRTSAYIEWIKEITKHGRSAHAEFNLIEAKGFQINDATTTTSTTTSTTTTQRPTTTTAEPQANSSDEESDGQSL